MKKLYLKKLRHQNKNLLSTIFLVAIIAIGSYLFVRHTASNSEVSFQPVVKIPETEVSKVDDLIKYTGKVEHIFFHSLIIYPELAEADLKNASGYKENMITVSQFKQIIEQLYENNFILINSDDLYSVNTDGGLTKKELFLPKGKKPLIISNYRNIFLPHFNITGPFISKSIIILMFYKIKYIIRK